MAIVHETVLGTITWNRRNNQPCTRGGGNKPGPARHSRRDTPSPPPREEGGGTALAAGGECRAWDGRPHATINPAHAGEGVSW